MTLSFVTIFFVELQLLPRWFLLRGSCTGSHSVCKVQAKSQVPGLPTHSPPQPHHRVTSCLHQGPEFAGGAKYPVTAHEHAFLCRTVAQPFLRKPTSLGDEGGRTLPSVTAAAFTHPHLQIVS